MIYDLIESNQSIRSLVIQGYLNGKPRDQIALDAGISAGTALGIIKDWISRTGIPNVEELRDFAVILKKPESQSGNAQRAIGYCGC